MGFWIPIGLIEYLRNIVHCHSRNLIHNWYHCTLKPKGNFNLYKPSSIFVWKIGPYPSLSNAAAGIQGNVRPLNFPCCWVRGLNCSFRYCLISPDERQWGIVPSLYWSRAAAMWALSSFSELQMTTRDTSEKEFTYTVKRDKWLKQKISNNRPTWQKNIVSTMDKKKANKWKAATL